MEREYENECVAGENTGSLDFILFSKSILIICSLRSLDKRRARTLPQRLGNTWKGLETNCDSNKDANCCPNSYSCSKTLPEATQESAS